MDSRDPDLLVPEFRGKFLHVLEICKDKGVIFVPYFTLRSPKRQGELWCQSRSPDQISQASYTLIKSGASYLAGFLFPSLGNKGRWATNALPGNSWHQWGEAGDCYLLVNGVAVWDASDPGYEIYAQAAIEVGLTPGKYWSKPDTDHIQLRSAPSPLDTGLTWATIDRMMQQRFPIDAPGPSLIT